MKIQNFDRIAIAQRLAELNCDPVQIIADAATDTSLDIFWRIKCASKLLDVVVDKNAQEKADDAKATTTLIMHMMGVNRT